MTAGHVRILTALVAAITLHALLLTFPLSTDKTMVFSNGLLHVELLQSPMPAKARSEPDVPAVSIAHEQAKPQQKKDVQEIKLRHTLNRAADPAMVAVQKIRPAPPVAVKSTQPSGIKQASKTHQHTPKPSSARIMQGVKQLHVHQGTSTPTGMLSSMTAGVQSMLLASIHYPSMARRHGWQGAGEFQLDIDSQRIRNITILVSTGHTILDQAVRRGLASIGHVPVADGQYRLPVEFRLQ